MRLILKIISWASLLATILPAVLFLDDRITLDQSKWSLLAATIVWFAVAPWWIGQPRVEEEVMI